MTWSDWAVGIVMANAQSFCSIAGLALQRYSHNKNKHAHVKDRKPQYYQPFWLLGIAMYIGCQPFTVIALAYAPVSIIAPLGSLNIVYNAIICAFLIGEKFRNRDIAATFIAFASAVGVVLFGPKPAETEQFPSDRLVHFWDFPDISAYVFLTGLALVSAISINAIYNLGERKAICWVVIVAVITAWSQLFVKCFAHEAKGGFSMERAIPYTVTLVGVAATSLSSLAFMTKACKDFENRFFVSAIAALRIVLQQVQGAVFFQEWRGASYTSLFIFMACCGLCIISVSFISIRVKDKDIKKEDSLREELGRVSGRISKTISQLVLGLDSEDKKKK